MRTLDQIIAELPPDERTAIATRARQLIAEENALRLLRRARALTQQNMATLLHIDQAGVSKIESRSDMLLSTLRSYVEAMGGSLRLVAEFPEGVAELASLGEVSDAAPARKGKNRRRHPSTRTIK
ncbi:MAG TPA: XRE family transcriptional regulator [Xanthobacteraceae bacterium]|jgi:ABC-type transporter Mla MlaB component|nr:XRE family transcriptional regulator [Xanthobacteraceae bacterium]